MYYFQDQISEGTPFIGKVEISEMKYFSFEIFKDKCTILMDLSTINDGDPDLVLSYGENSLPTLQKNDWNSITYKGEELKVELGSNSKVNKSMKGKYVAGVYGYFNSTFSITYSCGNISLISLYEGFPQNSLVSKGETRYFEFQHYGNYNFRVIVSTLYGNAKLMINKHENISMSLFNSLPNITKKNYLWSNFENNLNSLHIYKNDPKFCYFCKFYIGVYGILKSRFSIVIAYNFTFINLKSGEILRDSLKKNEENLYKFYSNSSSIHIFLIALQGEVEIYIKRGSKVSSKENGYEKKYTKSSFLDNKLSVKFGEKYVILNNTNKTEKGELFSMSIKGLNNSNYVLSVTNGKEIVVLSYGIIDYHTLEYHDTQQYFFYYNNLNEKISILISFYNPSIKESNNSIHLPETNLEFFPSVHSGSSMRYSLIPEDFHFERNITSKEGILFQISCGKKGRFMLSIKNIYREKLHFTILLNNQNVNILLPNSYKLMNLELGNYDKYEIYSERPSKFLLEIFDCEGIVTASRPKNYSNLVLGKLGSEIKLPQIKHFTKIYDVESGPIYIGVKPLKLYKDDKYVIYQLRTRFFSLSTQIPYENIFAKSKSLKWKYDSKKNGINVNFHNLRCVNDCGNFIFENKVYYELHITNSERLLNSYVQCGHYGLTKNRVHLKLKQMKHSKHLSENNLIQFFIKDDELKSNVTYYMNVVAIINKEINDKIESFTFVYDIESFYINSINKNHEGFWKKSRLVTIGILLIIFFVILLFIIIHYYRRSRKMEKKLKYEPEDIRKDRIFEFDSDHNQKSQEIKHEYRDFIQN